MRGKKRRKFRTALTPYRMSAFVFPFFLQLYSQRFSVLFRFALFVLVSCRCSVEQVTGSTGSRYQGKRLQSDS